jgi:VanZ family protein
MKMNIRLSQKARRRNLWILSIILVLIIIFLLYTSEDPRWGSDNWEKWLYNHTHFGFHFINSIILILRKTMHFLGYGFIGLISWFYFYLWGFKKPLCFALIFTAVVAMLDEYTQSLTTFRFGKPQDVLLDIIGAIVATGLVKLYIRNNQPSKR